MVGRPAGSAHPQPRLRLRAPAGKDYYEQLIQKGGKPYLRAITPVPVVMDNCILCHDNYKGLKKGEPVGALTYTVPVE